MAFDQLTKKTHGRRGSRRQIKVQIPAIMQRLCTQSMRSYPAAKLISIYPLEEYFFQR